MGLYLGNEKIKNVTYIDGGTKPGELGKPTINSEGTITTSVTSSGFLESGASTTLDTDLEIKKIDPESENDLPLITANIKVDGEPVVTTESALNNFVEVVNNLEIELSNCENLSTEDYTVDDGKKYYNGPVIIKKEENLIPKNIKNDIVIAGVKGLLKTSYDSITVEGANSFELTFSGVEINPTKFFIFCWPKEDDNLGIEPGGSTSATGESKWDLHNYDSSNDISNPSSPPLFLFFDGEKIYEAAGISGTDYLSFIYGLHIQSYNENGQQLIISRRSQTEENGTEWGEWSGLPEDAIPQFLSGYNYALFYFS